MKRGMWAGKILIGTLVAIIVVYGLITGTQYLWNWLVPALFAGPVISFWQTAGLLSWQPCGRPMEILLEREMDRYVT